MKLLIDSGNTRLKWAYEQSERLSQTYAIINHNLNANILKDQWQHLPVPHQIAIACVNSPLILDLVQKTAQSLWPYCPIVIAQSKAIELGIRNGYETPETLGIDRWLALIAAYQHFQRAICVVDCGTAITIDITDDTGRHQGGLIAPGLALMQKSLTQNTARLTFNDQPQAVGFANNTNAGIFNGSLFAACGLIEHSLKLYNQPAQLVLTGGDASIIATQLELPAFIDEHLVLRGLSLVTKYNFNQ